MAFRVSIWRQARPFAAVLFIAGAGLSAPAQALESCATAGPDTPCIGDTAGTLQLNLTPGTAPRFELRDTSNALVTTQPIGQTDCQVTFASEDLISLSAEDTLPGFFNTLGVWRDVGPRGGNGQPCGKTEPGQALHAALTGDLAGKIVTKSTWDVELKGQGVVARIKTFIGAEQTGQIEIRSGDALIAAGTESRLRLGATQAAGTPGIVDADPSYEYDAVGAPIGLTGPTVQQTGIVYPDVDYVNCTNITDSGRDAKQGDHCVITAYNPWTRFEIEILSGDAGGIGWDGGSESDQVPTFTGPSVFQLNDLYQGTLDCGDAAAIEAGNEFTGAFARLFRLPNDYANNPDEVDCSACVPVAYNLSWQGDSVEFITDLTSSAQTCATFEFVIDFAPIALPGRPADDEPVQVDPSQADNGFGATATAQLPPLEVIQRFLGTDPQYYLDPCIGRPLYYKDDAGDLDPYLSGFDLSIYPNDVTSLVAIDPADGAFPDMSEATDLQYACWLDMGWEYDGLREEESDKVRLKVRGYKRGDWTSRQLLSN